MATPTNHPANRPLRQLWSAVKGRDSVLQDRPFSITRIAPEPSRQVGARLACFVVALGLTITIGLAGTSILYGQENPELLVHHLWEAVGGLFGVVISVAVTRSELRAAALLLVGGLLVAPVAIVASSPSVIRCFAPGGRIELGHYFALGLVVGIALGGRAAIAYRRSPSVTATGLGEAVRRAALIIGAAVIATVSIYWLSQKTQPGAPNSNAIVTGIVAAAVLGLLYHFVAPPRPSTTAAAEWKRLLSRVAPIAVAGPIASWEIVRRSGDHSLPFWVDGLLIGCLVGLFLGYLVDLIERPFAGRHHAIAAMTIVVVVIVPALRLLVFDHTSDRGVNVAQVGAVFGLVIGGLLVFATVRRPNHDVFEPDHPELELTRHTVLFLAATPRALAMLDVYPEARTIQVVLRDSRHANVFDFQLRPAAQFSDLAQALTELTPTVVHLSGHCDGDHFYFHAADDVAEPVPIKAIVDVVRLSGSSVKIAVINACKSVRLAEELTAVVDFTVGMAANIEDESAHAFAEGFYRALGDGKTAATAYLLGRTMIHAKELPGADIPCERARDHDHPGEFMLAPIQ
jgi:hypothetical protein